MDARDLEILYTLLGRPLGPVADIAAPVGLSESATRDRINRMRNAGILGDVVALPDAALLGKQYIACQYDEPDWESLFEAPSVIAASVDHAGTATALCLTDGGAPSDLEAKHGAPRRAFPLWDAGTDPGLSAMQWRILAALLLEPTATDQRLVEMTGLGIRTVRKHKRTFLDEGHVHLEVPVFGLRGDHVLFDMYMEGPGTQEDATAQALASRLVAAWPVRHLTRPKATVLFCAAADIADATAAQAYASRLAGVHGAQTIIRREGRYDTERIVAACEGARHIQLSAAQPPP